MQLAPINIDTTRVRNAADRHARANAMRFAFCRLAQAYHNKRQRLAQKVARNPWRYKNKPAAALHNRQIGRLAKWAKPKPVWQFHVEAKESFTV